MAGRVLHHAPAAVPDYERDSYCRDEINEREEDCVIKDGFNVGVAIVVVDVIEAPQRFFFGVEKLNGLRAVKMFLQKCVDARDTCSDHVIAATRPFAKPTRSGE